MLTGGGDAPGLNAVIRAVVKAGTNRGCEVIGLEDSFDGLIERDRWRKLTPRDVTGILRLGGTHAASLQACGETERQSVVTQAQEHGPERR